MTISTIWTLLLLGWTLSEIGIAVVTCTRRGDGNVQDRGSLLLLWGTIAASITACEFLAEAHFGRFPGGIVWLRPLALAIFVAGLAIRWTAILSLGRSFSANVAIRPTQTVKRTGLYRFVRHPSYLGMLVIFFAIGLHSRSWAGLVAVLLPTSAALLYRIHVEEAVLVEAFGAEYLEYRRETKRLVPGMY